MIGSLMNVVKWWNENWQGKPKYLEKTYPSGKPVTNHPNYGMASDPCTLMDEVKLKICSIFYTGGSKIVGTNCKKLNSSKASR
jgi:hypothetical protein